MGSLITDGNGNFYGTTAWGGPTYDEDMGLGVIYKWSASGGIQALASFNGTNGDSPQTGLVADGNGNLYGTTFYGGASYNGTRGTGYGAIFKWSASGGLQTLASFNGANGEYPVGSLIMDGSGSLYGATSGGGANKDGTIYTYSASGGIQTLASFSGADGNGPFSLIADGNGNFYGVTAGGGANNDGTVFKWSASGGIQTLASFGGANGEMPDSLVMDGSGNFYGTSGGVGTGIDGVIFQMVVNPQVSGTISMVGCTNLAQTLTFTLQPASGSAFSWLVTLAEDGSYNLAGLPNGTYSIGVKGPKWLRTDIQNVVVGNGAVSGVSATLLPGDINGDNVVDINDFSLFAAAYGSDPSSSNWNANADLNCDGVVDINDFSLLAQDYGMVGDPDPSVAKVPRHSSHGSAVRR
jgi:uncharacterized repeat protein (TIGR03803 family)